MKDTQGIKDIPSFTCCFLCEEHNKLWYTYPLNIAGVSPIIGVKLCPVHYKMFEEDKDKFTGEFLAVLHHKKESK